MKWIYAELGETGSQPFIILTKFTLVMTSQLMTLLCNWLIQIKGRGGKKRKKYMYARKL